LRIAVSSQFDSLQICDNLICETTRTEWCEKRHGRQRNPWARGESAYNIGTNYN
jgi:hypothetical protein